LQNIAEPEQKHTENPVTALQKELDMGGLDEQLHIFVGSTMWRLSQTIGSMALRSLRLSRGTTP
jgi:hypothetical protein